MFLESLSLINFKNYPQADFSFKEKLNCFVGDNGMGKTNLLDAIHYLSLTKSFFNSIDSQNIKYEEPFFMIQGKIRMDEKLYTIGCTVQRNRKKKFSLNKKDYNKLADHIGLFPVVMISPADAALVLSGSEERRKFIDAVISQYDKTYLEDLIYYNRALSQRNKLLKSFFREGRFDPKSLELWDEQLIPRGNRIFDKRVEFIQNLRPKFQYYYKNISLGKEKVGLKYKSQLLEADFREILRENREKDGILQYTTAGIHRDDLELQLNGHPIKKFGSQGQQKTYLVSLKFAKFDFIREITGKKPVLLLDDVFDKFDSKRVKQIIDIISRSEFGQIFITDTSQVRLENIFEQVDAEYKVFKIRNGSIEKDAGFLIS
jgi:DNA replication and repair protein RecF